MKKGAAIRTALAAQDRWASHREIEKKERPIDIAIAARTHFLGSTSAITAMITGAGLTTPKARGEKPPSAKEGVFGAIAQRRVLRVKPKKEREHRGSAVEAIEKQSADVPDDTALMGVETRGRNRGCDRGRRACTAVPRLHDKIVEHRHVTEWRW